MAIKASDFLSPEEVASFDRDLPASNPRNWPLQPTPPPGLRQEVTTPETPQPYLPDPPTTVEPKARASKPPQPYQVIWAELREWHRQRAANRSTPGPAWYLRSVYVICSILSVTTMALYVAGIYVGWEVFPVNMLLLWASFMLWKWFGDWSRRFWLMANGSLAIINMVFVLVWRIPFVHSHFMNSWSLWP